jgi:hypothetical protein
MRANQPRADSRSIKEMGIDLAHDIDSRSAPRPQTPLVEAAPGVRATFRSA